MMQVLIDINQLHTKLHGFRVLADFVAKSGPDMGVADEPDLNQLYAERHAITARINEKQRVEALKKGLIPITPRDIQEVLDIIFQSEAEDTKRGMVQKVAGDKIDVYSRILNYRLTDKLIRAIPPRKELVQVFGEDFQTLAAPLGSKINQAIPRMRLLLNVATEALELRAKLKDANTEIHDCHDQIEYGLGLSGPTKSTRGRKQKLDTSEVQEIASMKQQGLSNQAVMERVNSTRAEFGEPPVGLTAIKNIPALVAKQRISDQPTTLEPKALSRTGRVDVALATNIQNASGEIRMPDLPETDSLAMAEEEAIRELWGVDEERGIGFDNIGRHKPSILEKRYSRQFSAWKEGLNI